MVVRERELVRCDLVGSLQNRALALELAGLLVLSLGFLRTVRRYFY